MAQYIGNSLDTVFLKTKRQTYSYVAGGGQTVFQGADTYGSTFVSIAQGQVLVYENGLLKEPHSYTVYADRIEYTSGGAASGATVVIMTEVESALTSSYTRAETLNLFTETSLGSFSDINITDVPPTAGQTLVWDGAQFVPGLAFDSDSFDTAFGLKSTSDLSEGNKLYYTNDRVQTYLTDNSYATETYVGLQISSLVDSAPGLLDTLNELAAALGDDPNFATTIASALDAKYDSADFNTDFTTRFGLKSTSDLSEGTNQYYTNARADERIALASVGDLSDVDITTAVPTAGQALIWDDVNGVFVPGDSFSQSDFDIAFGAKTTDNLNQGSVNLFYTEARVNANFALKTTADLTEGSALYYTEARVDANIASKTTDNLTEGNNLYYTDTRVATYLVTANYATQAYVNSNFAAKTTDDLTEGTKLYYTDTRVATYLANSNYATQQFVGSAITTASADYATAAQGVLADSALQSADLVGYATEAYVGQQFDLLVDAAPGTLDTLNELAAALGDDANFSTSITNSIALKANSADLGTAAAQNVGYFATAAQGALADSALQSVAFADLTTTPTTLVGYGITDAPSALTDLGITDGTVGQILTTDGTGGFTFEDAAEPLIVSGNAPASPAQGALWFDNVTTGQLYAYVDSVWLSTAGISTLEFSSVGDLSDVDLTTTAPTEGQALLWDNVNSKFIPGNVAVDLTGYATETFVGTAITNASSNYATAAQGTLADSALQSVAFADLTTTPTTLVGYGITDAATSAQGALADSALQSVAFTDLTVTPTTLVGYGITDAATSAQGALADSAIQSLAGYATETYVGQQFDLLIDSAPGALDTLNELAAALGDDANFSTTITNSIALKANTADLGTAAAQDVEYFASAAQGTLADSALQSVAFADLTVTPTTLAGYGITDAATSAQGALADSAIQSLAGYATETFVGSAITTASTDYATAAQGTLADSALQSVAFADLTSTPTTLVGYGITDSFFDGTYSSLTGSPTLGTASAQDVGYFATAAQGTLADSALQSVTFSDLGITDGTVGQILTTDGAGAYTFEDAANPTTVSGTAPTTPSEGDLWFDNVTTGQLYAYVGSAWLSTAGISTLEFSSVGDLSDVDLTTTAPTEGQALVWDNTNSKFIPGDVAVDFTGYATETFVGTAITNASSNYATTAQGALADSALQSVAFADLTVTPTTLAGYGITDSFFDGAYSSLSGTPTLGTASAQDVGYFATAAQGALADSAIQSLAGYATETYVNTAVSNLVDAAPGTLDTLNELAAALGDDANFATTTANSIALKANSADLGTAAAQDVGYFATAAQGALADSALQSVAFADLTTTPTTLAGYGITDTIPSALTDLGITDGTVGQILTTDGAGTYAFEDAPIGGATVSGTNPVSPEQGALWFDDTNSGQLYTYVGSAWLSTAGISTLEFSSVGDLSDVDLTTVAPTDGQALVWDNANSKFIPGDVAVDFTGYATETFVGTAISTASSNYATSAQGTLADSALQSADLTGYATETYVNTTVSNIIDAAPGALDTLNELAAALGDDANFSTTVTNSIALKANSADLGTASVQDVGYFATAAQGALADSAIQSLAGYATETFVGTAISTASADYATSAQGALADSALQSVAFADLTTTPTTLAGYGITDTIPSAITDLGITDGTAGQILTTDGVGGITFEDAPIGGATVSGTNPVNPEQGALWFDDTNSGQLYTYVGSAWLSTAGISTLEFSSVGDLSDVDLTTIAPTAGQALIWDNVNSKFIPGDVGADFAGYATETFVGTAITNASSNYATAAQGTLADSALQSVAFADLGITDGTVGQVLTTDGAGNYSFSDTAVAYGDGDVTTYLSTNGYDTAANIVASIVDTAPGTLDTLNELAAALGDDPNFATTTANAIGLKANAADLGTAAAQDVGFFATAAQGVLADSALQSVAFADLTATPTTLVGYGITDAATAAQGALADSALQSADLIGYATETFVGTAISTASADYATAAQGTLADSALQSVAFADLTTTPTTLAGYGITDSFFDGAYSSLSGAPTIPSAITDLGITDGTVGQLLSTDGSGNFTFVDAAVAGSSVTVSGTAPTTPNEGDLWFDDTTTGQLYVYENGFWTSTGIPPSIGSIDDLGDVDIVTTAPTDGQVLVWDAATSNFVPGTVSGGVSSINDLTDVDIVTTAPTDGQSLVWDNANSKFIPGDSFSQAEFNTALGTISASIIPDTDITYDIGSATNRFRDLYLSGTTINLGGATLSTDATSGAIALTAKPTAEVPNPSSLVVTASGTTIAVATVGGTVDFDQVAIELAATPGFDGAFTSLTATPTTLAGYGITDAATTAQGALADSALQSVAFTDLTATPTTLAGYGITDTIPSAVRISGDAPLSAVAGDLWYDDVATGELYVYENDVWTSTAIPPVEPTVANLTDVDITTVAPTEGQALLWDVTSSKFLPGDVLQSVTNDDINWIPYAQLVDLPSATDNHGMFAHVHGTGKAYFAHAGAWIELANTSDLGTASAQDVGYFATAAQGTLADSALQSVAFADLGITDGTVGQVLTTDGSGGFTFADAAGGGGSSITTSETAPVSPSAGDMWFNSSTLALYLYYADGDSTQWIQINDIGDQGSGSIDDLTDVDITTTAPTDGQSLIWDNANSKFVPGDVAAGGGGSSITTSETAPVTPTDGDMWFNSATLALYLYYADGDSTQWIQINDAGGAAGNGLVLISSTPPANPASGDLWYDDGSTGSLLIYNGSVWVSTADGGGGGQSTYWVETSTTYDAAAGSKLFVDTSSSAVQVNLPASPVMGDEVYVVDAAGNSGTYNITVNRNGNKITGLDENFTIDVNGAAIILAYYNATRGWIVISK